MVSDPEQLGLAILRVKDFEKLSICDAADRVFSMLATRPLEAQSPQGRRELGRLLAGPEGTNGAHGGDVSMSR